MRLANMRAHRRSGVISGDSLQLRQNRRQIVRRMLRINEKPVEIGGRSDLGGDGRTLGQPTTNRLSTFLEGFLELVHRRRHVTLSSAKSRRPPVYSKLILTLPNAP